MRATIDRSCDMGYIYFSDGPLNPTGKKRASKTIEVRDSRDLTCFVIDIDVNGRLWGIEVFSASERMPKEILEIAKDITDG